MPELPEVEIVRRGLDPVMTGHIIRQVDLWRSHLRTPIPASFKETLRAQKVVQTSRRGKYILVFLENGKGFALHLGMSGRIQINPPDTKYERAKHDHIGLKMDDGTEIIFNDARRFGMVFLLNRDTWEQESSFAGMGPEPLGNKFNGEILAEKLKGKKTPIKTALLDQRIVAGVGNIYACEALFESGLSPVTIAGTLTKNECEKLAAAIRNVLTKAIKEGGSSLRDYRNTKGELGYFQHHFSVYDREGKPCPGCTCNLLKTGGVQRIVQAGRSTFFCLKKQKKAKGVMKISRIFLATLVLLILTGIPLAEAAETPQFFSSVPDMPLMEGLTELTDQTVVFDKPEGRIIESVALIERLSPGNVLKFYNDTLPQLGWTRIDELSFRRENEVLKVFVEANEGKNFLRLNIAPLSSGG
jgi:formamidopyrimidine-DNA glycosylase